MLDCQTKAGCKDQHYHQLPVQECHQKEYDLGGVLSWWVVGVEREKCWTAPGQGEESVSV